MKALSISGLILAIAVGLPFSLHSQAKEISVGSVTDVQGYQLKRVPSRPWSVEQVLQQQELLEGEKVLVAGIIRNIRRHRLIFGMRYTSFDLYGETGSFLRVHYNRKVYYGEDTKVVVQGRFNKSRGLIEASDVKPE